MLYFITLLVLIPVVLLAMYYVYPMAFHPVPTRQDRSAKAPILLIHGENDHFVPCGMSNVITKHCAAPVQLETFPNAEHGLSYLADTPRYEALIENFIKQIHQ